MQEMNAEEKWLFDVQGYLIVPGFLSHDEVASLNAAVDASADRIIDDPNTPIGTSTTLAGTGRRQLLPDCLTLPQPHAQPFRDLIAHPKLRPYLNTMLGRGWRMDHSPVVFIADADAAGLVLHGPGYVAHHGGAYYTYRNGQMRCGMIALEYALTDVNPGDGGFCAVPGSHKANFPAPRSVVEYESSQQVVVNPPHKAGDLVIFNEATIHGTLPWRGAHQRRALLFRYSPKFVNFAGGFHERTAPQWFAELTDVQRSVLEPPYLYDRDVIDDDGSLVKAPAEF